MRPVFEDRLAAGLALADAVADLGLRDPVVLALPRGGVPVAAPVAARLDAPLDLVLVRKVGMPGNPELAAGAVVDGAEPHVVFNEALLRMAGLREEDLAGAVEDKLDEIAARRARYLAGRSQVSVAGRTAVLVDDGIATGATVKAALAGLRSQNPREIVLAVPVAPADSLAEITPHVDRVVCLATPEPFIAVGAHYRRFDQVADDRVIALLAEARVNRLERRP